MINIHVSHCFYRVVSLFLLSCDFVGNCVIMAMTDLFSE